jgi:hypothetical protein
MDLKHISYHGAVESRLCRGTILAPEESTRTPTSPSAATPLRPRPIEGAAVMMASAPGNCLCLANRTVDNKYYLSGVGVANPC